MNKHSMRPKAKNEKKRKRLQRRERLARRLNRRKK